MKKIFYGITLILSVGMCLSLLFFPILKFDRKAIYNNYQDEIKKYVSQNILSNKSFDELEEEAINDIIYQICISLQMYNDSNDIVFDEDGNKIESGNDYEAIMFDVYKLKEKGIKYTDLANSIKNQFEYDIELFKVIKEAKGKADWKIFFDNWINPLPMTFLVILIAFEFACGVLLIIRSMKGISEKKRNKVFLISILGTVVSIGLLLMPAIFKTDISLSEVNNINQYVNIFAMNVNGTSVCYACLICFGISTILAFVAKFLRYNVVK